MNYLTAGGRYGVDTTLTLDDKSVEFGDTNFQFSEHSEGSIISGIHLCIKIEMALKHAFNLHSAARRH